MPNILSAANIALRSQRSTNDDSDLKDETSTQSQTRNTGNSVGSPQVGGAHSRKFGRVTIKKSHAKPGNRDSDTEYVNLVTVKVPIPEQDLAAEMLTRKASNELLSDESARKPTMSVRVKFRTDNHLLVGWDEYASLKAGTCDLYKFPHIQWRSKRVSTIMAETNGTAPPAPGRAWMMRVSPVPYWNP